MKTTTNSLVFDGMAASSTGGYNKKYQHNPAGQTARENYGIGPRRGNTGTPGPRTPALGSQSKSLRGGGTTVPAGREITNMGRGPTRGTEAC